MIKTSQDIIIKPIITERSMEGVEFKKYTFKVNKKCNKLEIKKACEELFSVQVLKVRTMNCKGRFKRQGKSEGYTPEWKKAIITLKPESKGIEFFEGMV